MNTSPHRPLSIVAAARSLALSLASALWLLPALAAQTDISNVPISSADAAQAKPNIMLLMDTSGSMGWGHMPDEVETGDGYKSVGYKNSVCNTLYYDPAKVYPLPKKADGTFYAASAFSAARRDPYDAVSTTTVDLSSAFKAYYTVRDGSGKVVDNTLRVTDVDDVAQPAYYYTYTGSSTLSYKTAPCRDLDTGASRTASDGGTWTKVVVSGSVQQQNFANWYSYYRTRMLLMKSSVSLAFSPLTESFRVGFITMQPKDTPTSSNINSDKFLPVSEFNSTQRGLWYDKLFSQKPGGASPAREGLARVGRYYAGKTDGINSGMGGGDPVQFSCQQNFTIMTTDGYWNDQTETPSGGPVGIDGSTRVGNQDGVRTANAGLVPPPIWEGNPAISTTTDKLLGYQFSACTSSYFLQSTAQILKSTVQLTASTSQLTESTTQNLQSTNQNLQSTAQNLQSTSQIQQSTAQNLQSTAQSLRSTTQNLQSTAQVTQSTAQALQSTIQRLRSTNQNLQTTTQETQTTTQITQTVTRVLRSTNQNLRSTSQLTRSTSQLRQSTTQNLRSTVQNLRSTVQNRQSTSQLNISTAQINRTTTQNLQSTVQNLRSTTQNLQSTAQALQSTTQFLRSTSQINVSTLQQRQSTTQLLSCDAATELCTPVATCTPGGLITCQSVVTGPTLVASCTPTSAVAGNNFTSTTCANTTSGPTPAASCTPAGATSGNSYTATTCNTVTTSSVPVASCTPASASSGNSWTATTCATNSTSGVPVASCTPAAAAAGNNYTATTCSTATSGPTAVASCTPAAAAAGNSYTATTCSTSNTTNVPVGSCSPSSASSSNSWTTTTCSTATTTNVPVATCTAASASSGNSWTTTTCPAPVVVGPTPVASCTAAAASAGNSYTATTCNTVTTGPTPTGTCTAAAATAGNSYTTTTCPVVTTTNVAVATCTAATASSGNSWTTTTCPAPVVTTNVPVATCTAATASSGNSWTTTTCPAPVVTTNVPVASCTAAAAAAGNSWTTTTCPAPIVTTNVPVASCTSATAAAGNSWTSTTCNTATTGPTGVSACTAAAAAAGNSWTATTCNTVTTTNVPVATCTAAAAAAGNSWTATTCPAPVVTTNVPVAACTAAAAAAGNSWTTTTCTPQTVSGPTVVAACTASGPTAGNGFQTTTCGTITNTVPVATCTPQTPNAGNGYTTITCNTTTNTVPVATCTPQAPTAGNGYTTITCPAPVVTTNVPVATCTAAAAAAGNAWTTTTCPAPITTTNVPVATCTAAAPVAGNSFVQVTCTNATTGPIGVASCTPVAAAAGNSWTATTCGANNTTNVPVATCTAAAGAAGNSWITTTCGTNNTSNVPVATCAASGPTAGNGYTTTTCAANNTSNVPVATCAASGPTAGNGYTTTTCATNNTSNVPVAACTASGPTAGNLYVTTTCNTATTTSVPVATCTPASASAGNSWTDVTCATNNTASVPVASCTPSAPTAGNGYTSTTCPTPVTTVNVPVPSCTPAAATAGNSWTSTTCTVGIGAPIGVASCTPVAPTAANGYVTTNCATLTTGPTGVPSCTNAAAGAGNSWTATTCNVVTTTDVPSASCSPTAATGANAYTSTTCNTIVTPDVLTAACTPAGANAGNNFVATSCTPAPGEKVQVQTTTSVFTTQFGRSTAPTVTTSAWSDLDGVCYATSTLPSIKPTLASLPTQPATPGGCSAWPCTTTTAFEGSTDSLADVAQYYYATDLRPTMTDNVKTKLTGPEDDRVKWQHMSTYALALGVSGTLDFRSNYKTDVTSTDTDFAKIRALDPANPAGERLEPSLAWPQWPVPSIDYSNKDNWNDARSIDDFWHAAVNGRGQFFSARSPRDVVNGIGGSLAAIKASSAGAPAGTSSLQPVVGNNFAYTAGYETRKWIGDLRSTQIDLTTGNISATPDWSAQALLNAKTSAACDNRNIYLIRQGATNNQVNFSWNTRACDSSGLPTGAADTGLNSAEQAYFNASVVQLLSHYPEMTDGTVTPVDQRALAADANMVNFLRGQRGLENFDPGDASKLYRLRAAVLGDIVNAQPVYVAAPNGKYTDSGYTAFKSSNSGRVPMVYVGANDGMLHAIRAGVDASDPLKGQEAWAVIPSAVLPKLYKLADNNYQDTHEFFVDGTPTVGDAYDSANSTWKTVLVGGLNSGGKGYFALDVTDPVAPKTLWEFKWSDTCYDGSAATAGADCHIGYTFGRPVISKLADGTWVVFVTSGHNNVNATAKAGDGEGYLYVLNAFSGKIIHKISTGAGSAATPSGLTQVSNWVDNVSVDNTTLRVYGGDLFGNIWRFDVNGILPPSGVEATLIGTAKDSSGNGQPITTAMELAELNGKPMVFVGTGKLLGASDLSDVRTQSIYGIIDNPQSGTTVYANLRSALKPLQLTQSGTPPSAIRTVACTGSTSECAVTDGWVVDLPDSGERVNVDMNLQFGTLIVGTNVPGTNPCDFNGYSWLNYFDFATGSAVTTSPGQAVSEYLANSLLVGLSVYRLPPPTGGCTGSDCEKLIVAGSLAPGGFAYGTPPQRVNPPAGKRISWREITQ